MVRLSATQGRNGLENNLAFYVLADTDNPNYVDRVSVILNVNAEKETAAAHSELARVTTAVAVFLTNEDLPAVKAAVLNGKSTTVRAGGWRVRVEYSRWKGNLGHDVTVRFTPWTEAT